MSEWIFKPDEQYAYLQGDERGWAYVAESVQGWLWEAHVPGLLGIDMDGWWGRCQTREEAQKEAEEYITKYGGPPKQL